MTRKFKSSLMLSAAAVAAAMALPEVALAQASSGGGLEEIVVTAQKREQSLQDVPIAVTALTGEALQANRVTNVSDLSGLAPGLAIMPTAGATKIPSFTLRGAVGNGVVPGSEKQVSAYLDGVYLSASRGGIFELPDIQRIEVLRGPQGTLFGRNATAGAVSISTRDPKGEFGVKATASIGNYRQRRFGITVDLPQMGPFSAFVSYVHNERRGDIRNTAPGQAWDLRNSKVPSLAKIVHSPEYLGDDNSEGIFVALKFESGDFTTTYKFDRNESDGTPTGTGFVGYDANVPLLGTLLTKLITTQSFPVPISADGKRPDAVANAFAMPLPQLSEGHNITSTYRFSDHFSVKNVLAFRRSTIFGAGPLDGFSSLTITPQAVEPFAILVAYSTNDNLALASPADQAAAIGQVAVSLAPLVGSPYAGIGNLTQARNKQVSDEIQFNYSSDFLTATVGGMWFSGQDWTQETWLPSIYAFTPIPGGVLQNSGFGPTYNKVTSLAAYAQLEFHLSSQIDIIAGARITQDKKTGSVGLGTSTSSIVTIPFSYKKTKPNFLLGVNYKPNDDILVYGKFSTAFVSGGSVAGIGFMPETVSSFEAGVKADLLDRRLRVDLAVFHAQYKNVQGPNGTQSPSARDYITLVTGDPDRYKFIGTYIQTLGDIRAQGFELDVTAKPANSLTLGGSLGFTDSKYTRVEALYLSANGGRADLAFRPKWTGSFWVQFDSPKIGFGDAYASFRIDGHFQSRMNLSVNRDIPSYQTFAAGALEVPANWVLNGRFALKDINIGGANTELAVWAKNMTDNRSASYALNLGVAAAANYIPARTYGMDLTVKF